MRTTTRLTTGQRKRARRLFDTAARRVDRAIRQHAYHVSSNQAVDSGDELALTQSWSDGQCEYTLQLTARRHN